jgi:SAM-dependent methyltransferase
MTQLLHTTHPRAERGRRIEALLRAAAGLTDDQFDELYPMRFRGMSSTFWTPVQVARRAAELLVLDASTRVLDIGSGTGKFCLVGAASTAGDFYGIEQRHALVECARDVAGLLGPLRASFEHGLFDALDPESYDAFYLFNPFEENRYRPIERTDRIVGLADDCFRDDVCRAQAFLAGARPGARVVTYNGIGGPMPAQYDLVVRERLGCVLELWQKS